MILRPRLQVGGIPDDWDCYDRAEVIPSKKPGTCRSQAMRRTLIADADFPAAEVAGYAAAAFASSAALLQRDDPEFAVEAMKSAYAVWKFGERHNKSASTWSTEVVRTYGVDTTAPFMLYGAAMIAWVHRCEDTTLPLCREAKARPWLAIAEELWLYNVVRFNAFGCAMRLVLCVSLRLQRPLVQRLSASPCQLHGLRHRAAALPSSLETPQ